MHNSEPKVIFEDQHLIVISKPAGLLSQGEITGSANVVDWLRKRVGRNYVGLIHRLDRNTSGLMVLAKRSKAATRLTDSLQKDELHRTYLAWVHGGFKHAGKQPETWRHWLLKNRDSNTVRVVAPNEPGAQEAVLFARPIGSGEWRAQELTLVEFTLLTGRSHQIRVQAAKEGHPLLGDLKYGGDATFGRPALHSCSVRFPHPMSHAELRFEDQLPADMSAIAIKPLR
jgi:23S rRNA pseudouridine1911/1915/1917 synthase